MRVYRIDIYAWTASFRFPNMISGFQPSLRVPPISTVWGLISAALGTIVSPMGYEFAYIFRYESLAVDLETVYQFGESGKPSLKAKSNVIRREFLQDAELSLYLRDEDLAGSFKSPYYPVLLGRSGDLATVRSVKMVDLEQVQQLNLAGTVVPFRGYQLAAPIQALPTHFSDDFPRRNLGTQPFYLLDWKQRGQNVLTQPGWRDAELGFDLFWYDKRLLSHERTIA